MQQLASSSLFQTFTSLTEVSNQLRVQLAQAAKDLQEKGEIPGERLIEDLMTLRRQFLELSRQGMTVAEALSISSLPPGETLTSLRALQTLLERVSKAEEHRTLYDEVRQRALAMLDRVMLLQHRDHPDFPPLLECQERAREMRDATAAAQWPHLHPATESLANGEDPFSDLLAWVEQQNSLDDEDWALLQDTVEQFFSKPLAIAVSRGKLIFSEAPESVQPSAPSPQTAGSVEPQTEPDEVSHALNGEEKEPLIEEGIFSVEPRQVADETSILSDTPQEIASQSSPEEEKRTLSSATSEPQHLPETVPLEALYRFGPEDSAQQIALTIAQEQNAAHRPVSLRDLTWRLILEEKISLAFHLASYLDTQYPKLQPRLPAWLLRAIMLSRHVRHAKGETARFLEEDFAHFSSALYLPGQSEWNQSITFLLVAAALQPALLAPHTQAPAVLHALHWEANLPQFSAYCESIAAYGEHQRPLDPHLLKKGKEQAAWQSEIDMLKQGVELWWTRASRLPFVYAPATKVWQKWLEPKGVISALLFPIRQNDASKLAVMKRAVEMFSDDAHLKREVNHTDHDLLGRHLGGDISGRSLEQLRFHTREAIGFAQRWVELQEIHSGHRQDTTREEAERLRQTIWTLQGAVQEELSLFKRRHPSPLIMGSVICCRRAIEHLQLIFDPEAVFPSEEPLPRPLLYADLLRIPTVSLNEQWEIEGSDWEALADGVVELVVNGTLKKTAA
jgi:hypothetical protein